MASAKDAILKAIKANKPQEPAEITPFAPTPLEGELLDRFKQSLGQVGGKYHESTKEHLAKTVSSHFPNAKQVCNQTAFDINGNVQASAIKDPHDLATLDLAVIEGKFGVAENAAIWVDEASLGIRVLPFIAEHLAITLSTTQIMPYLHEAYEHITGKEGFGTFISGPSKTADIEQSLVIGAHGPKSLTVFLYT